MASGKDCLASVMERLSDSGEVTFRPMMGEYVLYYRGKAFGGIYDDRFLVKFTKGARALLPDAPLELPYEGAKPMLSVDGVDDRALLQTLLDTLYAELPAPKRKR